VRKNDFAAFKGQESSGNELRCGVGPNQKANQKISIMGHLKT